MIKDRFTGVPTWPALILVPILICVVLGFQYFDSYKTCTGKAEFRNRFITLAQQASEQSGAVFDVTTSTDFSWDTLKVINAFKTDSDNTPDCPFDWDWSKSQREQLSAQGQLTMLVFVNAGKMADYLELDKNILDLGQLNESYNASEARFKISKDTVTSRLLMSEDNE